MKKLVLAATLAAPLLLGACALATSPDPVNKPDPVIVAEIKYVCAFSGLFKFVAGDLVALPGAEKLNEGVTQLCLHPEKVAGYVSDVKVLIAYFKSLGKI